MKNLAYVIFNVFIYLLILRYEAVFWHVQPSPSQLWHCQSAMTIPSPLTLAGPCHLLSPDCFFAADHTTGPCCLLTLTLKVLPDLVAPLALPASGVSLACAASSHPRALRLGWLWLPQGEGREETKEIYFKEKWQESGREFLFLYDLFFFNISFYLLF